MIGFLLKKAFWDAWDNMGRIIVVNLLGVILLAIPVFAPQIFSGLPILGISLSIIGYLLLFIYISGASLYIKKLVNYETPEFKIIIEGVKTYWKQGLFYGIASSLFIFIVIVGFRFYSSLGNMLGLIGMAFLFWISLIVLISLQYFFPILTHLDRDIRKILKKCFILFFDNTLLSIVVAVMVLVNGAFSLVLAFLLPGIGGILVLIQSAMKLIMMKYDYLEENPETSKKEIPWFEILMDEKDRVGKRTLKGTIFPWKE